MRVARATRSNQVIERRAAQVIERHWCPKSTIVRPPATILLPRPDCRPTMSPAIGQVEPMGGAILSGT
eukprot:3199671-Prymnesium_polylepis.1